MTKTGHSTLSALLITAAALVFHASFASADDFPTAPTLRVETGAHSGAISSIASDAANQYLVSGGQDKTVRVWSLPRLELLKTLRPPIGRGQEGSVSALAMSPDGARVAVGGEFCRPYEGSFGLFVFDTASGAVVRRLTGFETKVSALAWSPDGAVVAAGMGGSGGLRLFRTSDWSELGRDADYSEFVGAIHFDRKGRLATASFDGKIRLYGYDRGGMKLIRGVSASSIEHTGQRGRRIPNRGRPSTLRFSPDGSRLAVGHKAGTNWVAVLSADSLEQIYLASTEGLEAGIQSLDWSPDGKTLYAGTSSPVKKPQFIRKWSDGGRGGKTDLQTGNDIGVSGLIALKDGGVLFSTGSAALGRYESDGSRGVFLTASAGNFYDSTEEFKISNDGSRIQFAYEGDGKGILNFDLRSRRLAAGAVKDAPVAAPTVNAGTLRFQGAWRNARGAVEAEEIKLAMGPRETSRCLAIAPDRSSVVVGTSGFLRHYSAKDGAPLWTVPVGTLAVNVSGDGRLVVGATPQGWINWYRRTDGRLLLTLFVASDKKRWALISPTGFYDTSVGGEELIGWHVNRGKEEAADFFPVSRLRERFYRPEVIAGILEKADDAEAIRLAGQALGGGAPVVVAEAPTAPKEPAKTPTAAQPPQVTAAPPAPGAQPEKAAPPQAAPPSQPEAVEDQAEAEETTSVATAAQVVADVTRVLPPVVAILSPPSGSAITGEVVKLRYTVRSAPDAPVTSVRARINGLAQDTRALAVVAKEEVKEMSVTVPPEDSEILLFAENKFGVSAAAAVKLYWRGAKAPTEVTKPVLYVLAVGVSKYRKPEYRLQYAAKDAGDFVGIVNRQKGGYYSDVVVKLLTDESASNTDVSQGFEWLQKQVSPKDVGMVFIAGHGVTDERGDYFYLPFNADLDALAKTGVPFSEIKSRLANLRGRGLLFVDTCHSGNVMGARKGLSNDVTGVLNELSSAEYSLVVIASSTGRQYSLENDSWGNGAFTKALVEGFAGQADLKKRGRITHKMLDFYISDRVDELTKGQQTPVNASPQGVPDFTIAIVVVPKP